jgi:hypothetical protein
MHYVVTRTSLRSSELKPCDEAVKGVFTRVDMRTADDPKKIAAFHGTDDWWYREGQNHRVIKKRGKSLIARDFADERWYVEIETLDQLMQFIDKYGECVVGPNFLNADVMSIEIYDGYRE